MCVYIYMCKYMYTWYICGVVAVKCPSLVSHSPKQHSALVALDGLINLESRGCLRTEDGWKTRVPLRGLKCHLRLTEKPFPPRSHRTSQPCEAVGIVAAPRIHYHIHHVFEAPNSRRPREQSCRNPACCTVNLKASV